MWNSLHLFKTHILSDCIFSGRFLYCTVLSFTCSFWRFRGYFTSCLPPEQAKDKGVSLVLSDWASISAPLSSKISTTPTWPAVAAKISGVNPETENMTWVKPPQKPAWRFHMKSRITGDLFSGTHWQSRQGSHCHGEIPTLLVPVFNVSSSLQQGLYQFFMATSTSQCQGCVMVTLSLNQTDIHTR